MNLIFFFYKNVNENRLIISYTKIIKSEIPKPYDIDISRICFLISLIRSFKFYIK